MHPDPPGNMRNGGANQPETKSQHVGTRGKVLPPDAGAAEALGTRPWMLVLPPPTPPPSLLPPLLSPGAWVGFVTDRFKTQRSIRELGFNEDVNGRDVRPRVNFEWLPGRCW